MSDDGTEMVRTTIQMPENIRDEAKAQTEHGQLSEMVRDLYREVAFGEEINKREQYKRQLERVRDEKEEIRSEIRDLQSELESLESREARLEERLSEASSLKDKYEGMLEMLESDLYSGAHIFEGYKAVSTAARAMDIDESDVIAELKERNPDIPEYAFMRRDRAGRAWDGIPGYEEDSEGSEDV